jgi:hypothetical protein
VKEEKVGFVGIQTERLVAGEIPVDLEKKRVRR